MNLPHDVSRCHGLVQAPKGCTDCQQRANCERWLNRTNAGKSTPWVKPPAVDAAHPCVFLIPAQG